MGEARGLEKPNIFDETAHVVEGYGEFTGMDRDEARAAVVAWFEEHGLLEGVEDHEHNVMHCYRCDSTLEPWLSEQWFVAVDKLKERATEVVKTGEVAFHPERWTDTYLTWMENLKDWCISRQLWWGHRIPVFYCEDCGWEDALMEDAEVCPKCGGTHVHQDEDVLDTWFSSQLWTFATQGWPGHLEELVGHHPTQVLVTARDIIALWVARMIMSSLYFLDEIPFHDVYIYATILAKDGSRMSKSKGNGVDPLELVDKYGADAMRHNLLTLITTNQDVRFDANMKDGKLIDSPRTDASKSFVTKIWNASRFVLMNMNGCEPGPAKAETPEDAWMLSRLAKTCAKATEQLTTYDFGEYARDIQSFFWNEVCDWYIELCKGRLNGDDATERLQVQRNLMYVLDVSLRLLHPVMPFVTEKVWSSLPASAFDDEDHAGRFLMMATWPEPDALAEFVNDVAESEFEQARRIVSAVRSTRARYRLSPKEELDVCVRASTADSATLEAQAAFIHTVGLVGDLLVGTDQPKPAGAVTVLDGGLEIYVVVGGLVDLDAERNRVSAARAKAEKDLAGVEKTLANENFTSKAAPEVVEKKRETAAALAQEIEQLTAELANLG